jgi:hypothetical protein
MKIDDCRVGGAATVSVTAVEKTRCSSGEVVDVNPNRASGDCAARRIPITGVVTL